MVESAVQTAPFRPAELLGRRLDGRYEIVSELGEGSFAHVYEARHVELPHLRFAIKVLRDEHVADPEIWERFQREARLVSALRSRNAIRVLDLGQTESGHPYFVMELIEGEELKQVIDRLGPLTDLQTMHLTICILRALVEAHQHNVVHRDLKPHNIMITHGVEYETPEAIVLDFGIAKALHGSPLQAAAELTQHGFVMCTPKYAAPEQLVGKPEPQSDLYALGLVIAEMVLGEYPCPQESTAEYASMHMSGRPLRFSQKVLDSAASNLILRACAKRLNDRFASAEEMLQAAQAIFLELVQSTDSPFDEIAKLSPVSAGIQKLNQGMDATTLMLPAKDSTDPHDAELLRTEAIRPTMKVQRMSTGGAVEKAGYRWAPLALAALVGLVLAGWIGMQLAPEPVSADEPPDVTDQGGQGNVVEPRPPAPPTPTANSGTTPGEPPQQGTVPPRQPHVSMNTVGDFRNTLRDTLDSRQSPEAWVEATSVIANALDQPRATVTSNQPLSELRLPSGHRVLLPLHDVVYGRYGSGIIEAKGFQDQSIQIPANDGEHHVRLVPR